MLLAFQRLLREIQICLALLLMLNSTGHCWPRAIIVIPFSSFWFRGGFFFQLSTVFPPIFPYIELSVWPIKCRKMSAREILGKIWVPEKEREMGWWRMPPVLAFWGSYVRQWCSRLLGGESQESQRASSEPWSCRATELTRLGTLLFLDLHKIANLYCLRHFLPVTCCLWPN